MVFQDNEMKLPDDKLCLLCAFAKLRKTTVGFFMSVCPHGTRLPLDGFS
jgi:hypothetical protein